MSCYNAIIWITMACGLCAQLLLSNSSHPISSIPCFFPPTPSRREAFHAYQSCGRRNHKDPSSKERNENQQSTSQL